MKTYFNKLNEQSEIFTDRDIDKLISDSKSKEIVMGFPIYIKAHASDLMPFYEKNYKSRLLDKLEKEKIYFKEKTLFYDVTLLEDATEIEDRFMDYVNDYLFETVSDIVNKSQFKDVDDGEKEDAIYDYISKELVHLFGLSFLNKDKRTGDYIICRYRVYEESCVNVIYDTKNINNSFGIKNGDPVSKEHLIEYEKELCCIFGPWGNIYSMYIYSMWFDDL